MIEKIKIGEIIQADVTRFIIACSHREQAKEKDLLGCLVKTESQHHTLYSVIANIEYIPTDSSRSVLPLGLSRHKLNQEMNHLYELIHIKYTTVAVGYSNSLSNSSESVILYQGYSPISPELHDFVYLASMDEIKMFFMNQSFFVRMILNRPNDPVGDELLVVFVKKYMKQINNDILKKIVHELAYVLGSDLKRLEMILQRISEDSTHL